MPQIEDGKGPSEGVSSLVRTPGLRLFYEDGATTGNIRGIHKCADDRVFFISGDRVVEIESDKTVTVHGTIGTTSGHVNMADNAVGGGVGDQLIIVDGVGGFIFDLGTDTLAAITDLSFPQNATHVDYIDGFFIVNEPGTQKFYKSASFDGTTWDALEFASAEQSPDRLQGLKVVNGQIWLVGTKTTEV